MFAKIAKYQVARYQVASARRAAPASVAFAHSNDNTAIARAGEKPSRPARPKLVCRWRPMIGGGLDCRWDIESAGGVATEEPDQRWISVNARLRPTLSWERVGRGPATGRLALPAAG
jgi:hypothetical protein